MQKKLYLGRESGVESWRPLFAADKLLKAAHKDLKLREGGVVSEVIGKLAEKHKIKVTTPVMKYTIKRGEVRTKLKEFSRESLPDVECLGTTWPSRRRSPTARPRLPARTPGPSEITKRWRGFRRFRVPIYPAPWPC